jgi:hypothetical protein
MTAEIELDETPSNIAKELLELGLIHEVIFFSERIFSNMIRVKIKITYIIVKSLKDYDKFSAGDVNDKFSSSIWRLKSKTKGYFCFNGDSVRRINILLLSSGSS